ncbi:hypothetical protein pb186bvf_013018 [Paramecium bursaria]
MKFYLLFIIAIAQESVQESKTEGIGAQDKQASSVNEKSEDGPNQFLVYTVVIGLVCALLYFIYNFYVCHKKKIDTSNDYGHEIEGLEIQQAY